MNAYAYAALLASLDKEAMARRRLPLTEEVVAAYGVIAHVETVASAIEVRIDDGDIVLDVKTPDGDGVVRIDGQTGGIQ